MRSYDKKLDKKVKFHNKNSPRRSEITWQNITFPELYDNISSYNYKSIIKFPIQTTIYKCCSMYFFEKKLGTR